MADRVCLLDSDVEQGDAQTSPICEIEENEAKSTPGLAEQDHRAEPWSTGARALAGHKAKRGHLAMAQICEISHEVAEREI